MRCPATRFATSTISHLVFLILLAVATLRIGDVEYSHVTDPYRHVCNVTLGTEISEMECIQGILHETLRPKSQIITYIQLGIILFVVGIIQNFPNFLT